MKQIRNLTPHAIGFYQGGVEVINWPSEGSVRLEEIDQYPGTIQVENGTIPTCERAYGSGTLPDQLENVVLIVSQIVCEAFPHRMDLYFPAFDVRDSQGKFIGTTKLCQVPK